MRPRRKLNMAGKISNMAVDFARCERVYSRSPRTVRVRRGHGASSSEETSTGNKSTEGVRDYYAATSCGQPVFRDELQTRGVQLTSNARETDSIATAFFGTSESPVDTSPRESARRTTWTWRDAKIHRIVATAVTARVAHRKRTGPNEPRIRERRAYLLSQHDRGAGGRVSVTVNHGYAYNKHRLKWRHRATVRV